MILKTFMLNNCMNNTYKIAKDLDTGKYFDGSKFTATREHAFYFPPHITTVDFKYNFEHVAVVIEETDKKMRWETNNCPW